MVDRVIVRDSRVDLVIREVAGRIAVHEPKTDVTIRDVVVRTVVGGDGIEEDLAAEVDARVAGDQANATAIATKASTAALAAETAARESAIAAEAASRTAAILVEVGDREDADTAQLAALDAAISAQATAFTAEITSRLANLVDNAPGFLDTLGELAAYVQDHAGDLTDLIAVVGTKETPAGAQAKVDVETAARIAALAAHVAAADPHGDRAYAQGLITAEMNDRQYWDGILGAALNAKADLVAGKVPLEQLPDDIGGGPTTADLVGYEAVIPANPAIITLDGEQFESFGFPMTISWSFNGGGTESFVAATNEDGENFVFAFMADGGQIIERPGDGNVINLGGPTTGPSATIDMTFAGSSYSSSFSAVGEAASSWLDEDKNVEAALDRIYQTEDGLERRVDGMDAYYVGQISTLFDRAGNTFADDSLGVLDAGAIEATLAHVLETTFGKDPGLAAGMAAAAAGFLSPSLTESPSTALSAIRMIAAVLAFVVANETNIGFQVGQLESTAATDGEVASALAEAKAYADSLSGGTGGPKYSLMLGGM